MHIGNNFIISSSKKQMKKDNIIEPPICTFEIFDSFLPWCIILSNVASVPG